MPSSEGNESPYVKLYSHGFKIGNKWYIENCPTTIGDGSPCPVCEANGALWATGSEDNKEIVRKRKRKLRYISNVMVLSDAKHPENEGKIFLFSYGSKIFNKLMNAINPEFEDETSFNPFDFWEGAPFKIKIRNVEGYRNYDKSEFGDIGPLMEDDDALETVWKSQYDLKELIAPRQFKTYDDLKRKFMSIVSVVDTDIVSDSENTNPTRQSQRVDPPRQSTRSNPSETVAVSSDEDDDLDLYRKMIDD